MAGAVWQGALRATRARDASFRGSPAYAEAVRARIRCAEIVRILHEHIRGERALESTQVQAAAILLRKVVPDRAAVDVAARPVRDVLTDEQARQMAQALLDGARLAVEAQQQQHAEAIDVTPQHAPDDDDGRT